jgi:NDP-sugar pyrophosphorylase family protein
MVIRELEYQVPYGVVEVENSQLLSLQEKPIKKYQMSAGIYVLSPEALDQIPLDTYFDMTDLFHNALVSGNKVMTYLTEDYWLDIGRYEEFAKAQRDKSSGIIT